jgi:putative OmpL-like beta-barrel porin-2
MFTMIRRTPSLPLFLITLASLVALLVTPVIARAQSTSDEVDQLKKMVRDLQSRVATLEQQSEKANIQSTPTGLNGPDAAAALAAATSELKRATLTQAAVTPSGASETGTATPATQPLPANLPGGATLNYMLDGYYEYNFNQPSGRVNDLRAYDVLSNAFSINQADIVFALDPNVAAGRRYGFRVDLQFGQATETSQGNPANEPRPDIYRNIFQVYGTYVVPLGGGLNIDIGKWASSLGAEGNFTKDQINYTRSFYFYFLPFYHAGVRTAYHVNDKIQLNYWVVNGTNQQEPTNGYKDELFGYVLQPTKALTWTSNYYLGQDHPDSTPATNCPAPVQPGLCLAPISPAPNGKLHIFDTYATWQVRPKLTLQGEADYVIQREWANAAPGESSAPSHVDGGAAYAQYQISPRISVAARVEYLSDRGGLFSQTTQALKEATSTYEYKFGEGFDGFLEFRRDWSNRPYFQTNQAGAPSNHQNTAAVGLVWWYGGKQGAW